MKNFYAPGIALVLTLLAMSSTYSQISISNIPINQTAECSNIPLAGSPVATSDCTEGSPEIFFEEVKSNGMCPGYYTITRTWAAVDACGNSAFATQEIYVEDSTPPEMETVTQNLYVTCDAIPAMVTLQATDNCDTDLNLELFEFSSNTDCETGYTITRVWEATDNCGNKSSRSQFIYVQDETVSTASKDVERLEKRIELFPNPATTQLNIKLEGQLDVRQAELFDVSGNLLKSVDTQEQLSGLNLAGFEEGIYILRLKTDEGIVNKRFVIAG